MAKLILLVGAGGGIGTILRYLVFRWLGFSLNGFPLSTFFVNLLGCFLIGVCWAVMAGEKQFMPRLFFITGMLGGFTTFSSFGLETFQLLQNGKWKLALVYVLSSNILGLIFLMGGYFFSCRLKS